jgi:hypothetical protein
VEWVRERPENETIFCSRIYPRLLPVEAPMKMTLTDPAGEHDLLSSILREIDGKTRGLP